MKAISDQDHEHAQQVWNRIKPRHNKITLGHYHDVYPKTDVLLLADVFEVFRLFQAGSSTFLHRTRLGIAGLIKDIL